MWSHHFGKVDFRYHPTDREPDSSPPSTPEEDCVQSEAETVLETLSKPMSGDVGLKTYRSLLSTADDARKVCIRHTFIMRISDAAQSSHVVFISHAFPWS